jgi:beta-phosphoglucomutase
VIRRFVFDLDGTLVATEKLKALSYARAATELRPDLNEADVVAAFEDFVGLSRQEIAVGLLQRFRLEDAARVCMEDFGVGKPWQAYVRIRLRTYESLLSDPERVIAVRYPHNLAREDVEHGKPDPEMHLLVARELGVEPSECLAIEDSPAGIKAALAAGAQAIAVTTDLTRSKYQDTDLLDRSHVVDDPHDLPALVRRLTG